MAIQFDRIPATITKDYGRAIPRVSPQRSGRFIRQTGRRRNVAILCERRLESLVPMNHFQSSETQQYLTGARQNLTALSLVL